MASTTVLTNKKHAPDFHEIMRTYESANNNSLPFLTIYEKTSIISLRMAQLANGAPTYLDTSMAHSDRSDLRKVAERELKEKKLPFMVQRKMPNGKTEYWRLDDLIII
jgi:DNA-directed RNA polymerases I, II, and III subunit RPABC2